MGNFIEIPTQTTLSSKVSYDTKWLLAASVADCTPEHFDLYTESDEADSEGPTAYTFSFYFRTQCYTLSIRRNDALTARYTFRPDGTGKLELYQGSEVFATYTLRDVRVTAKGGYGYVFVFDVRAAICAQVHPGVLETVTEFSWTVVSHDSD